MYTYETLFKYIARTALKDRPVMADLFSDNEFMLTDSTTVTRLMNQALHIMAIETHCLIDTFTTQLNKFEYQYPLDASILHVKTASITTLDGQVVVLQPMQPWLHYQVNNCPHPRFYSIEGRNTIRFDCIPQKDFLVLNLTAARKSLVEFDPLLTDDDEATKTEKLNRKSDIPEQYQDRIEYYVASRLLSHRDVDKNSLRELEIAERRWREALAEIKREAYSWQIPVNHVYHAL